MMIVHIDDIVRLTDAYTYELEGRHMHGDIYVCMYVACWKLCDDFLKVTFEGGSGLLTAYFFIRANQNEEYDKLLTGTRAIHRNGSIDLNSIGDYEYGFIFGYNPDTKKYEYKSFEVQDISYDANIVAFYNATELDKMRIIE